MALSYQDVLDILRAVDRSDCQELVLDVGGTRLIVQKRVSTTAQASWPTTTPAVPAAPAPRTASVPEPAQVQSSSQSGAPETIPAHLTPVRAPMVGRFYRAPRPGAPPFVESNQIVQPGDTVCIIEVMKLMNQIKAGLSGRVVAIATADGEMVAYGQPLMLIEPGEHAASPSITE